MGKKLSALLILVMIVLIFSGCSESTDDNSSTSSEKSSKSPSASSKDISSLTSKEPSSSGTLSNVLSSIASSTGSEASSSELKKDKDGYYFEENEFIKFWINGSLTKYDNEKNLRDISSGSLKDMQQILQDNFNKKEGATTVRTIDFSDIEFAKGSTLEYTGIFIKVNTWANISATRAKKLIDNLNKNGIQKREKPKTDIYNARWHIDLLGFLNVDIKNRKEAVPKYILQTKYAEILELTENVDFYKLGRTHPQAWHYDTLYLTIEPNGDLKTYTLQIYSDHFMSYFPAKGSLVIK